MVLGVPILEHFRVIHYFVILSFTSFEKKRTSCLQKPKSVFHVKVYPRESNGIVMMCYNFQILKLYYCTKKLHKALV